MKFKLLSILLFVPFLGMAQNCKGVKKTVDDMTNSITYHGKEIFMPSFAGKISDLEYIRSGSTYAIIYSHVFWEPKRVSVDTSSRVLVKLTDGTILTLPVAKYASGVQSVDFITKRTFTTINIVIVVTEEQTKQIASLGIEKLRFTTVDNESIDDKTNKYTFKDIKQLANCILQAQ